jgi:hypothetical protein
MKGRYWNYETNKPEEQLVKFLDEKAISTKKRIKEATGVDVEPIYYAAGYKDGDSEQKPYNLSKLLAFILRHTKEEKRAVFIQDINRDTSMWEHNDELANYNQEVKETLWESVKKSASSGADVGGKAGEKIGSYFGDTGRAICGAIGAAVGGAIGAIGGFFSGLFS